MIIHSQPCRGSDQVTARRCIGCRPHIVSIAWSSVRVWVWYLKRYDQLDWPHELFPITKKFDTSHQSVTSFDCLKDPGKRPFMSLAVFFHEQHDVALLQSWFLMAPFSTWLESHEVSLTPLAPKLLMNHLQVFHPLCRWSWRGWWLHRWWRDWLPPWAAR